ncbi:MAG TPA: alpha/beta fold hydrolase [Candidatus Peribacterales bacterium]|nr:alpha/beta fold hydrolase [Candidatus Peribacterales bacterium]
MPKAFLFHGTGGHSAENWFPWMKTQLVAKGYETVIPDFPDSNRPHPSKWYPVIDVLVDQVGSDSLVIGHSLGGVMALRLLERIDVQVDLLALVATPLGIPPIQYIEGDSPFLEGGFQWEHIRSHAKHSIVFHSDNDPFVCMENGESAAEHLGVELTFVPNAGHFNASSGFTKFPILLDAIQKLL